MIMVGEMAAQRNAIYEMCKPILPKMRSEFTTNIGDRFVVSTIAFLNKIEVYNHLLVTHLGRGKKLYKSAREYFPGEQVYEEMMQELNEHEDMVIRLMEDDSFLVGRSFLGLLPLEEGSYA